MHAKIQTLKAEILADAQAIVEIYAHLHRYDSVSTDEEDLIAIAYYLHNLYCACESIFQRVAEAFENHISDKAGWHAGLLYRMTLDIESIRPRLVHQQSYDGLDELRRFRHVFRSAYRLQLDAERLALVQHKAYAIEGTYQDDLKRFLTFLDSLLQ